MNRIFFLFYMHIVDNCLISTIFACKYPHNDKRHVFQLHIDTRSFCNTIIKGNFCVMDDRHFFREGRFLLFTITEQNLFCGTTDRNYCILLFIKKQQIAHIRSDIVYKVTSDNKLILLSIIFFLFLQNVSEKEFCIPFFFVINVISSFYVQFLL